MPTELENAIEKAKKTCKGFEKNWKSFTSGKTNYNIHNVTRIKKLLQLSGKCVSGGGVNLRKSPHAKNAGRRRSWWNPF